MQCGCTHATLPVQEHEHRLAMLLTVLESNDTKQTGAYGKWPYSMVKGQAMPAFQNILVAVVGLTPQVITETIYYL